MLCGRERPERERATVVANVSILKAGTCVDGYRDGTIALPQQLLLGRPVEPKDLNAADVELLAFVHVNVEGNKLFRLVNRCLRNRSEIDIPELSVDFAQILKPFRDSPRRKYIVIL